MNPDKKYMSQSSTDNNDIKFVPPAFVYRSLSDDESSSTDKGQLDLFSSESGLPELCYYSDELDESIYRDFGINIAENTLPTTFDVLRNMDMELNETEDLERNHDENKVDKIYCEIEKHHPGIFATLYSYRIPRPIVRVIIKRLIKLTLSYCEHK